MGLKIGDVSLLGGMLTGQGMTGNLMRQGFGGMLPAAIAKNAYEEDQEEEEDKKKRRAAAAALAAAPKTGMKKGGAVKAKSSSASKRADGCAQRGKTKGRMV
jgi:hypothetical protein